MGSTKAGPAAAGLVAAFCATFPAAATTSFAKKAQERTSNVALNCSAVSAMVYDKCFDSD